MAIMKVCRIKSKHRTIRIVLSMLGKFHQITALCCEDLRVLYVILLQIIAHYPVERGEHKQSLLLVSGWYSKY